MPGHGNTSTEPSTKLLKLQSWDLLKVTQQTTSLLTHPQLLNPFPTPKFQFLYLSSMFVDARYHSSLPSPCQLSPVLYSYETYTLPSNTTSFYICPMNTTSLTLGMLIMRQFLNLILSSKVSGMIFLFSKYTFYSTNKLFPNISEIRADGNHTRTPLEVASWLILLSQVIIVQASCYFTK